MRILFALPGLHRVDRGAERAFISIAASLVTLGDTVTLIGSGTSGSAAQYSYEFLHCASINRKYFERFPFLPALRDETSYEELTFVPGLIRTFRPKEYDITVTCSYPFTNWILRRPVLRGSRPRHIFVTQNGDWPALASRSAGRKSEYRFFGCINPDFFDRNKNFWNCRLIPNGVDCERFQPGEARPRDLDIPHDRFVVLMVSALIPSKRVEIGIEAVSRIPEAHLVVAGDGPLRNSIEAAASGSLPGRFTRLTIPSEKMPAIYQSSDVLLHCSQNESFGNVFTEALACGLPIVANDTPRVRWIVGEDEFLVDMNDVAAVAEAIRRARHSKVAGIQKRIERAKDFSWRKIAEKYRQFFDEVLAGNRRLSGP
jgi:glycosyltransferase involved in cell wall biosynthesis